MTARDEGVTLGEQLREARLARKISQDELARRVKAKGGRWTIRRWETDENVPDPKNRAALMRELSLPAGFFDGVRERPGEARLSRRVDALEAAVRAIERQLFGEADAQVR